MINHRYMTIFRFIVSRNHPAAESGVSVLLSDLNFDGQQDILIPAGADPRSNIGYYLYLVNNKDYKLTYVNGFNDIGNPDQDSSNKVIVSCILSGQNYCKFYFLDKELNLCELQANIVFQLDKSDSISFEKALAEAARERTKFE